MGQKTEEGKNWRIVRNRVCIRALLIFLGIILMQVLAYMLCVAGIMLYGATVKQQMSELLGNLAKADVGNGTFIIAISLISALLSGLWCGILYWKSDWREHPFDYRTALSLKNILAAFATGVGFCLFLQMVLTGIAEIFPQAFGSYNQIMGSLTDSSVFITVLYVLLAGPAAEELIFRGAILDRFYLAFPFWAANFLQALLFGVYHMNFIQGMYAFCLGMVLGFVRHVSGSILVPIFIHILFNTTSYLTGCIFSEEDSLQTWMLFALLCIGFALLFGGLRHWWRSFQKKAVN